MANNDTDNIASELMNFDMCLEDNNHVGALAVCSNTIFIKCMNYLIFIF